jgi:hypothetical protein
LRKKIKNDRINKKRKAAPKGLPRVLLSIENENPRGAVLVILSGFNMDFEVIF